MSQRNVRKLFGGTTIPPPNESSDEEYEPLYAKNSKKSTYEGLVISSSSESENESAKSTSENSDSEEKEEKPKNTKNQQKRKNSNSKNKAKDDLDEIDKSLLEVNAMLGEPSQIVVNVPEPKADALETIFSTKYKHLNVAYELNRIFGRDTDEENQRRRGRQPNLKRIQRYSLIRKDYNFKKAGLSMSINRRENDLTFFTFDHSREYQRIHKEFLMKLIQRSTFTFLISMFNRHLLSEIGQSLKNMHVEGLLEEVDMMFRAEDNTGANTVLEHVIAYMQFVAHPSFNITDIRTRLEYKFMENRPFHIALLKYLHLLTNRACHRTALEIAKLLLNLDPTDPLAVVFIIDTVALRAREHQWLIDAIDYLDKEREAGFLFNIKYSYALAHFHVASKKNGNMSSKEDLKHADELIKKAMIAFPWTVTEILDASKYFSDEHLRKHELFDTFASSTTCKNLKDLTNLYVAFAGSWWNEQPVREWLLRNGRELADKYDNDITIKEEIKNMEQVRNSLFRGMPREVLRHLSVIKYMSDLLIDREVPHVEPTHSFDPHPPRDGINRYNYATSPNIAYLQLNLDNALITNFFASLHPNFEVRRPEELHYLYYSTQAMNALNALRNATNGDNNDDDDSDDSDDDSDDVDSDDVDSDDVDSDDEDSNDENEDEDRDVSEDQDSDDEIEEHEKSVADTDEKNNQRENVADSEEFWTD
ncbi:unnamed protein product [Euphydryas editha]|uniref:Transcription factor 25 n=1 Tax=Euphydryas editha TaxID=104508 RepID=A0AAU9UXL6_EUPED|nr:unnamed protein product [Euphydryas editha]